MISQYPSQVLVLPLPVPTVLLPGTSIQVPLFGRADAASLLDKLEIDLKEARRQSVNVFVGCVPIRTQSETDGSRTDPDVAGPSSSGNAAINHKDLCEYGTLARLVGIRGRRASRPRLVLTGVRRFRIERFLQMRPHFRANIEYPDTHADSSHIESKSQQLREAAAEYFTLMVPHVAAAYGSILSSNIITQRLKVYFDERLGLDADRLADFVANMLQLSPADALQVLQACNVNQRIDIVLAILHQKTPKMKERALSTEPIYEIRMQSRQRRMQEDEDAEETNELAVLEKRLASAGLTPEASKLTTRELRRLKKMNPSQAEFGICRTYLETCADLPWSNRSAHILGTDCVMQARAQLDRDHYGLDKIKQRLLEYIAVLRLKQKDSSSRSTERSRSPILLLVGPPGTGKTSLAKSVAAALGRKFHRISLGGVRDEAELRGHRRTYVAAMPGMIISALRSAKANDPVFLLDEIDKCGGSSIHGDPSAALLEILDPEQNHTFTDHYLGLPFDLSNILFIATANTLDTISTPLLDRMEVVYLNGYTTVEKQHIARRFLLPKQCKENGIRPAALAMEDDVLQAIITQYTREAGVRNLDREIGAVCRNRAIGLAEKPNDIPEKIHLQDLEAILGISKYDEELAAKAAVAGVVTGLVAYSGGAQGSILFIEVAAMPGKGRLQLTGRLGEVLKESVEVALSWVKGHANELGLCKGPDEDILAGRDIHVHCPEGAVPKDGPSAGLAHAIALVSLFSHRPVPPALAMTGEVSLRGRVMPVGGITEKLIGAHRAGVRTVLLPARNRRHLQDVPQETLASLDIVFIGSIRDALNIVWPTVSWQPEQIESRL